MEKLSAKEMAEKYNEKWKDSSDYDSRYYIGNVPLNTGKPSGMSWFDSDGHTVKEVHLSNHMSKIRAQIDKEYEYDPSLDL